MRYLSFDNSKEFLDKLHKTHPYKVDIGPVYNRQVFKSNKKFLKFFSLKHVSKLEIFQPKKGNWFLISILQIMIIFEIVASKF